MMLILLTLAALFLAFAVFCMFGLPYMLMGPRMFDQLAERRDQQVMAGALLAAAISLVLAPFFVPGLISDGSRVQVMAETLTGFIGRA
ncbi:MAG: hypothetical protein KJ871_07205 [Alphaproteobacteria bacterium]|uniref:hypothetical protein n=1 Tax=Hyphomonas sp. TaxID=87 RepID=UPI001D4C3FCD|nr:hypothetical protein [Alphaproteobacteria bacterium]MBU2084962.1 hypothetical protein [Alphaproteobacteria bacterium]MBU2143960.1 hypothetical protein [Alphaproteobacteria bacterium]MBU2198075.1 hypothetical protein [Alphaproteobacteria bacterium]